MLLNLFREYLATRMYLGEGEIILRKVANTNTILDYVMFCLVDLRTVLRVTQCSIVECTLLRTKSFEAKLNALLTVQFCCV